MRDGGGDLHVVFANKVDELRRLQVFVGQLSHPTCGSGMGGTGGGNGVGEGGFKRVRSGHVSKANATTMPVDNFSCCGIYEPQTSGAVFRWFNTALTSQRVRQGPPHVITRGNCTEEAGRTQQQSASESRPQKTLKPAKRTKCYLLRTACVCERERQSRQVKLNTHGGRPDHGEVWF